ncbi:MAG: magnesium transporter, partial [Clostridia bacterium]|nr:magnesium transporter [Clostridia bacterium]
SAGSIMSIEFVDITENMTVSDAFDKIRETGVNKETIYTCYVIDENRKLVGLVTVMTLLTSPQNAVISDIMDDNVIFTTTDADKEDVSKLIEKYDLLAVPVVDLEHRLVGIVTVDDAIDVIQEEAEEDFAKMNAITPMEKPYLKTSVFNIWKSRIPWLMLMMVSATFTGMIISSFEDALAAQVVLTAFIPMLMDTGGNSGSQASVTIIRGLSLGEIEFRDILKVIWKEIRVSVLCGISLAVATFIKIMLINNLILHENVSIIIALVVCITMAMTIIIAKFIGCTLPLFAKKIGFDPAVMASPFITTIVDAVSLLIYFSIAKMLLHI